MKFWHKILLLTLIVFITALDISVITIMRKSWSLNLNRDIERASSEQALVANNIYENLNSIKARGVALNEQVYHDIVLSYAGYYAKQGARLKLWSSNGIVYPLVFTEADAAPTESVEQVVVEERRYIQISKSLPEPYSELTLVYQKEIESLFEAQKDISRFFLLTNIIVGLCLLFVLYFIVKGLTRPLVTLSSVAKQIAGGDYTKRIKLKSKDEFDELAYQFNKMAEAVEVHIAKLSALAETNQRMVDNLAHELRTPLTSMQGFSDFLINAKYSEEERIVALEYIGSETKRLNRLVFKLLDISNLNHEHIRMEQVDVNDMFETVRQVEERNLREKNQRLVINCSIKSVEGDFDLLVMFLINCVDNAIHASGEGTNIVMSADEQDGMGVIEVSDNGFGMNNEQVDRAVEAFYKADKSRSREHGGAGLGLTLCKQIAEVHKAELKILSEMGSGTKIRIILQLCNNF